MSPKTPMLPRVWGTRFDTLPTTPPVSPPSTCEDSSHASDRTVASEVSAESIPHLPEENKQERTPHEASIFVGSLPASVDQHELTRLLSEHLSEHTEIQNIKVVRDSKGGVCAFVQCEDATSAALLINTLQNRRPKPFLGRHLRYEPARAFRTLLVSYRAPVQHAPINLPLNYTAHPPSNNTQLLPLDLPFAMRIWRNLGSKFHTLSYNAEAITSDAQDKQMPGSGKISLFMNSLSFDEDSIRSIASYFGDLEQFRLYERDAGSDGLANPLPSPHDAPRAAGMHHGCWEIKWKNRDDCVAALMTLRRVPHLTVTWAHQPSGVGFDGRSPSTQFRPHQTYATYPFYTQPRQDPIPKGYIHGSSGWEETIAGDAIEDPQLSNSNDDASLSDTLKHLSLEPTSERLDWSETDVPQTQDQIWRNGAWASPPSQITSMNQETRSDVGNPPFTHFPTVASAATSIPLRKVNGNRSLRDIDPTTLFVGGLEASGSSAWTEESLADFFKDYAGLESIRLVQPQNGNTGFAFIKFNNTESPERAVLEKHNSNVNGRAMRVQLREIHSPRNFWRNSRTSRGRFQPNVSISRHVAEVTNGIPTDLGGQLTAAPPIIDQTAQLISRTSSLPLIKDHSIQSESPANINKDEASTKSVSKEQDGEESVSPRPASPALSVAISSTLATNSGTGLTNEWTSDPPTAIGTPPLQVGPMAAPGFPYPTPYYHPSAWFHPYAQPIPYQMPYVAYPAQYHHGHLPQYMTRANQPDSTNATAVTPWMPVGPYNTPPTRTPTNDPNQGQVHGFNSRAPLSPAGFLHNDQGTLIAVYQPEALDSYMTGSQRPPSNPQPPVATGGIQHTPWSHYPQAQGYSYPTVHHVMAPTNRQDVQVSMSNQASSTPLHSSNATYDSPFHREEVGKTNTHRRQTNRKDNNGGHAFGKLNHSYRYGQRHPRGNYHDARPYAHEGQTADTAQQPNLIHTGWNHWDNGH